MDTDKKSNKKIWVIVIILLAIVVAFVYLRQPSKTKTQMPSEFISGKIIESGYDKDVNIGFVKLESDKKIAELADSYRNILKENGWNIETDENILEESHRFFAGKNQYKVNIFIQSATFKPGEIIPNKRVVTIHYILSQPGINYK
ncbi:MAG: hypothetical protein AAB907_00520 [Patescibacteria group bacterium]